MGKIIESIMQPKRVGLVGAKKPAVLILSSPMDKECSAVRYSNVTRIADERGYWVLNKGAILFGDDYHGSIKPHHNKRELTIWLECHGAPGWIFSESGSAEEEIAATQEFGNYLKSIERDTKLRINNIILNACFSANEFLSEETGGYFLSPARLLSNFFAECNVVGFIGTNASAVAGEVFRLLPTGVFLPIKTPLESMAVLFRDNRAVELPTEALFCNQRFTPQCIVDACKIDPTKFYQPSLAITAIEELLMVDKQQLDKLSSGDHSLDLHAPCIARIDDDEPPGRLTCYGVRQQKSIASYLSSGSLSSEDASSADGGYVSSGSTPPSFIYSRASKGVRRHLFFMEDESSVITTSSAPTTMPPRRQVSSGAKAKEIAGRAIDSPSTKMDPQQAIHPIF